MGLWGGLSLYVCVVPAGRVDINLKFPQVFHLHSTRVGLADEGGPSGLATSEFQVFIVCRFFCIAGQAEEHKWPHYQCHACEERQSLFSGFLHGSEVCCIVSTSLR